MVSNISKSKALSKENTKKEVLTLKIRTLRAAYSYYVHFYKQIDVKGYWYQQLDIYAECQGNNRDFVGIADLNLNRSYNGVSRQFSGKCEAKVENSKSIYWVVNGDFYANGTTSYSFGGSVGISRFATLECSVSGSDNHFGYVYSTGYVKNR